VLNGLIVTLALLSGVGQASANESAIAGWTTDLHVVRWALHHVHPNAFHSISSLAFDRQLDNLRQDLPKLSRNATIVRLAQVITTLRECHTGFGVSTAPPVSFHALPVKVYYYSDGPFIQAAAPPFGDVAGGRVVRIGNESPAQAIPALLSISMASDKWSSWGGLPYTFRGEVLQALGISPTARVVRIDVVVKGKTVSRELPVVSHPINLGWGIGPPPGAGWVDARVSTALPLYLEHADEEFLLAAREQYVYARINQIADGRHEKLSTFWDRVIAAYDAKPRPLIVDLRENGGGDNTLLAPVIASITKRPGLQRKHELYVVVGRATQSAAENFVTRMQAVAPVIVVGEPSGETPNQYGDPVAVRLPYSGIMLHVSTHYYHEQSAPPNLTIPSLPAALSSRDYQNGIDPALRAIELDISRNRAGGTL
jgi:hypothetical protein